MNIKIALLAGVSAFGCLALAGCGGGSSSSMPAAVHPQMLDTNQVLVLARASSEVNDPLDPNSGAITVTPADDESSDPVDVNGT